MTLADVDLFAQNGVDEECCRARVKEEMHDLWTQWIVVLRPQRNND